MGLDALCEPGDINHYFWCSECRKNAFATIRPSSSGSLFKMVFGFPDSITEGGLFEIKPYGKSEHKGRRVGFTRLATYQGDVLPSRLFRNDLTGLAGGLLFLCADCLAKAEKDLWKRLEEKFMDQARELLKTEICELAWAGVLAPIGILRSLRLSEKKRQLRIERIRIVIENFEAIDPEYAPYDPKFMSILKACLKRLSQRQ